jgi:hypothetical protein
MAGQPENFSAEELRLLERFKGNPEASQRLRKHLRMLRALREQAGEAETFPASKNRVPIGPPGFIARLKYERQSAGSKQLCGIKAICLIVWALSLPFFFWILASPSPFPGLSIAKEMKVWLALIWMGVIAAPHALIEHRLEKRRAKMPPDVHSMAQLKAFSKKENTFFERYAAKRKKRNMATLGACILVFICLIVATALAPGYTKIIAGYIVAIAGIIWLIWQEAGWWKFKKRLAQETGYDPDAPYPSMNIQTEWLDTQFPQDAPP